MILDSTLQLAAGQAVTASAATENTIDFGQKTPNLGMGHSPLYAVLTVPVAFAGLTSLRFSLQDSDKEAADFVDVLSGLNLKAADLTAGAQYVLPLPVAHKRYLRGYFTVQGTATAGKVNVVIASGIQMNNPAPESPNVYGSRK